MKRLAIASIIVIGSGIFASCEKCATCTFNDPEEGVIRDEFCDKGHRYDSALKAYEDNNWSCSED